MGYTIMDVSKNELNVSIRAVKDHRQKVSEVETLANFKVQTGTSKIEIKSV